MLKAIGSFLIGYVLLVVSLYGMMCLALRDTPTSTELDCIRNGSSAAPRCSITENYFLGLSSTVKPFLGIKQARRIDHMGGRRGTTVIYGIAIEDMQGNGFNIEQADGEKNAAEKVRRINSYRDNPSFLTLHIVNDMISLVVLAFVLGLPAIIIVFGIIYQICGVLKKWYNGRKAQNTLLL